MVENMKRALDEKIAQIVQDPEKEDTFKLAINEDTSFDIKFGTYDHRNERYFYIKMTENTADAPFYYIRSYTIKELHKLNKIYKIFDKENLDEIKRYMKTLFDENKVSLKFGENEVIIKMNINAELFATEELLYFELYREMIPEKDKDDKLLDLYILNKNEMKALKEITIFLNDFKGNQKEMEFVNDLKKILSLKEVPGIEKGIKLEIPKGKEPKFERKPKKIENIEPKVEKIENKDDNRIEIIEEKENIILIRDTNEDEDEKIKEVEKNKKEKENQRERERDIEHENENQNIEQKEIIIREKEDDDDDDYIDINSKIFTDLQDKYQFNSQKDKFKINLTVKNIFDEDWKANTIKLVCNEKDSTIKCSKIKNWKYDIEKGQNGDFEVRFYAKDMIKGNSYKCFLQLFVGGKKITNDDVELEIEIVN